MKFKIKIRQAILRFKQLRGDPGYIARGMAIGVFIGITPTIPFHTVIALGLSFLCKASKPAAALGVWIGNPFTIPFIYWASYQAGIFLMPGSKAIDFRIQTESILELAQLGLDVTLALLLGGVIIGIPPGIAAYVIAYYLLKKIRKRKQESV